jgi:hypothetical protein
MIRGTRTRFAVALLGVAILLNIIILARGEESAGWPIAAIVLLGTLGVLMISRRREP